MFPVSLPPLHHPHAHPPRGPDIITSLRGADLNSRSATRVPSFTFPESIAGIAKTSPITLIPCPKPMETCLRIKEWLVKTFEQPELAAEGIIRLDWLELEKIGEGEQVSRANGMRQQGKMGGAWIVFWEGGAGMRMPRSGMSTSTANEATGYGANIIPTTIIAVFVPHDPRVRYFYTIHDPTALLIHLAKTACISANANCKSLAPESKHHKRIALFIRENFLAAVTPPHHPDYVNAVAITDYCPPIRDPKTALARLDSLGFHYSDTTNTTPSKSTAGRAGRPRAGTGVGRELSDDRYLFELQEIEREVFVWSGLEGVASYLLVKREFFKAFWVEIHRSEKIDNSGMAGGRSVNGGEDAGEWSAKARKDEAKEVPFTPGKDHDSVLATMPSSRQNNPSTPANSLPVILPISQPSTAGKAVPTPPSAPQTQTPRTRTLRTRVRTPGPATAPTSTSTPGSLPDTSTRPRAGYDKSRRNRVRTDHAHQVWLQREFLFGVSRAKALVAAWKELGFLDEEFFAEWAKEGGLFERNGGGVASGDEEEGDGEEMEE